jgi:hypothetical protein
MWMGGRISWTCGHRGHSTIAITLGDLRPSLDRIRSSRQLTPVPLRLAALRTTRVPFAFEAGARVCIGVAENGRFASMAP